MRILKVAVVVVLASLVLCLLACIAMYLSFGRDLVKWPVTGLTVVPTTPTPTPTNLPLAVPSTASAGDTWTRPSDGTAMVYVPAGEFLMGSTDEDPDAVDDDERPQHTVYLDAFWIDRTEVTNAQYRQCVERGPCREPRYPDDETSNAPDQPVQWVSWHDAQAYAEWVGGRLPAEAEWEKAARGTDGRIYPWGDSPPDYRKAVSLSDGRHALPVGSCPAGASPYGALDMAGNLREWVTDWYDEDYYGISPMRNPQGPASGEKRVLRGGSLYSLHRGIRCAARFAMYPDDSRSHDDFGFRLVVAPVAPDAR